MAEKPILFNTDMVRAILDGRKTQTRRVVKGLPLYEPYYEVVDGEPMICDENGEWHPAKDYSRIQPGDVLWVRETWAEMPYGFVYRASGEPEGWDAEGRWRPSIHMPKEAARLFLRVKDVGIERLQDMTEDDAFAEGYDGWPWCYHKVFENYPDSPIPCFASDGRDCPVDRPCDLSIPELFGREIWEKTIKPADLPRYGWNANPWVWVIEFERVEKT